MRRRSGFIRKTLILIALALLFTQMFLSGSHYLQSREMRDIVQMAIVVMTAWGIVTLFANRLDR